MTESRRALLYSDYPDPEVLEANLLKIIRRGIMINGFWQHHTLRLYDAAMRTFSDKCICEAFYEAQTVIDDNVIDVIIAIHRNGHVRMMTREAYERYEA